MFNLFEVAVAHLTPCSSAVSTSLTQIWKRLLTEKGRQSQHWCLNKKSGVFLPLNFGFVLKGPVSNQRPAALCIFFTFYCKSHIRFRWDSTLLPCCFLMLFLWFFKLFNVVFLFCCNPDTLGLIRQLFTFNPPIFDRILSLSSDYALYPCSAAFPPWPTHACSYSVLPCRATLCVPTLTGSKQ